MNSSVLFVLYSQLLERPGWEVCPVQDLTLFLGWRPQFRMEECQRVSGKTILQNCHATGVVLNLPFKL